MPGIFIAFEGPDGAGKSTQARLLAEWLAARGLPQRLTREPGGTDAGERIRDVLLHATVLGAKTELLLMLAARAALVEDVVRPALAAGVVVVCDRFELSTLAYQAYGRQLPLDDVRRLNDFATGGLRPDLTLVLDVPEEVGAARGGRGADRIERAGAAFHARVREAYALLADADEAIEKVDGSPPPADVHAAIVRVLAARFPETFG